MVSLQHIIQIHSGPVIAAAQILHARAAKWEACVWPQKMNGMVFEMFTQIQDPKNVVLRQPPCDLKTTRPWGPWKVLKTHPLWLLDLTLWFITTESCHLEAEASAAMIDQRHGVFCANQFCESPQMNKHIAIIRLLCLYVFVSAIFCSALFGNEVWWFSHAFDPFCSTYQLQQTLEKWTRLVEGGQEIANNILTWYCASTSQILQYHQYCWWKKSCT